MTAYACVEHNDNDITVRVEIRSYNSRHLDLVLRLPMGYASMEERIKGLITACIERGRVEVRLKIQDKSEAGCAYEVDMQRAKEYTAVANQLNKTLQLASQLSLDYLMGVPGVVQPAENQLDVEAHWPLMAAGVGQALEALDEMRQKEGLFIGKDFTQRLAHIEKGLHHIENATHGLLDQYREKLQTRVEALTRGVVTLDDARISQEAAIMADRSDISEETVRVHSHIQQFREIMDSGEPAGRKLNFLLQEFNREFNTMGSKVGQADVAHTIVDIKAEIEKLREQVQNIE